MRLALFSFAALALSAPARALLAQPALAGRQHVELAVAHARAKIAARQSSSPYGPLKNQACPFPAGHNYVRIGSSLSSNETDYVAARLNNAKDPLGKFFARAKVDVDALDSLVNNSETTPRIAIAISGGGFRAMLHGSGGLSSLDSRDKSALGGLLQGSTYMAGISGGSWAITSFAAADMASPYHLDGNVWNLQESLVDPSGSLDTIEFYTDIVSDVLSKHNNGFDISMTDLWARALSYHLFDNDKYPDHAASASFGPSIRATSTFQAQQMPFPLVVALDREPGKLVVGQNASTFVFTPYEFGGYDLGGQAGAFVPVDYVGTFWDAGTTQQDDCVSGFANLGFIPATSATFFSRLLRTLLRSGKLLSTVGKIIEKVYEFMPSDDDDTGSTPYPNPFHHFPNISSIFDQVSIGMVDGVDALDNIPLWPLLNPLRKIDFIMAFDSSADNKYNWPNGTAMIAMWNRTVHNNMGYSMPNVPTSPNTWINLGLNARPTFFGCNASDVTNHDASHTAPVIAYIPAYPWSTFANTSEDKLQYSSHESRAALDNGVHSATLNNTVSNWPACLACAAVKRSVERSGRSHSAQCTQCYNTWCWNGATNNTQPATWAPQLGKLPKFVADLNGHSSDTDSSGRRAVGNGEPWTTTMIAFAGAALSMLFSL